MSSKRSDFDPPAKARVKAFLGQLEEGDGAVKSALQTAEQIIIFGSYACGSQDEKSDLDVLIVGPRAVRIKSRKIDLVGLDFEEFQSGRWIRSELAHHVARYGIWLK